MPNSGSDSNATPSHLGSKEESSSDKLILNYVNKAIEKFEKEKHLEQFKRRKEDELVEELRRISINKLDRDDFFHNFSEKK